MSANKDNPNRITVNKMICHYLLITIKAVMTKLDFLVTITQETFEIYKKFFIGNKEPILLLHVMNVFFQAFRFVLVKETLFWIDFWIFLALGQRGWDAGFWKFFICVIS